MPRISENGVTTTGESMYNPLTKGKALPISWSKTDDICFQCHSIRVEIK
jgi:hypothetical protein